MSHLLTPQAPHLTCLFQGFKQTASIVWQYLTKMTTPCSRRGYAHDFITLSIFLLLPWPMALMTVSCLIWQLHCTTILEAITQQHMLETPYFRQMQHSRNTMHYSTIFCWRVVMTVQFRRHKRHGLLQFIRKPNRPFIRKHRNGHSLL